MMAEPASAIPFDFRSLEIFLTVCETGSMDAAARKLGLTQPAVSLSVAEFERRTECQLFDRSVRPMALTLAGGLIRQRAGALISDASQIGPLLREMKRGYLPLIRVGLVDSLNRALSSSLATYLASRAEVVSVLSGLTATHASELLTRRLDLFLGVDDFEALPGLERWELIREPYVLLLPKRCANVRSTSELKSLAKSMPIIRFSARSQTGLEIDRHLRRLGIEAPRSYEFDTPFAVTSMVASGVGFAITTPLCISEAMMKKGSTVTVKLPGPQITRKLTLVARFRELGQLPRELADVARKTLHAAKIPGLHITL